MSRLTRDGTAEPVSRGQILRHARGQGSIHFPCSADHEQDWQPYPVDPYSAICDDHTYIYIHTSMTSLQGTVLYCTLLIKLNWRQQCKVVFRVGTQNTNCDIQQQSNAIKRLCLVYATTVCCTRGRTTRYYVLVL